MLMVQYTQVSFRMIFPMDRGKKHLKTEAFTLALLKMVTFMESVNIGSQTNRLSMKVCG